MRAQIQLGRIFGIPVGLHYSWLIIALLIALSLVGYFQATNPAWSGGVVWALAIVATVLFFAAIIAHELTHAVVAKARGLPVRAITLFALGGVAQIEKGAADPKTEFWMGIAGPIASVAMGAACLAVAYGFGWAPMTTPMTPLLAMLVWLGSINIMLALFNMIPGFPLDGGRVLRAVIWWATGNADRSTRIAARVGQFVAFALIVLGLLRFFSGAGFGGLWIAFIGWFLLDAARASYAEVETAASLRGVRVSDVMTRDCPVADRRASLQAFVDEHLLRTGRRCFIVKDNSRIVGLITPHEVKEIGREQWPQMTVGEVMRPLDQLHTVSPETPVTEVLETMAREDVNQLPVASNGHLEGIISRAHILQVLQARHDLHM